MSFSADPHDPNRHVTPEPSIGKLVADATRDISALIQSEITLAKTELKVSARAGGMGIALVLAAVFVLLVVVVLASMTIAYLITLSGLHVAWAFLIVTGLYLLIAVVLGFLGYRRFTKVKAPEKTIATAKTIPSAFKPSSR